MGALEKFGTVTLLAADQAVEAVAKRTFKPVEFERKLYSIHEVGGTGLTEQFYNSFKLLKTPKGDILLAQSGDLWYVLTYESSNRFKQGVLRRRYFPGSIGDNVKDVQTSMDAANASIKKLQDGAKSKSPFKYSDKDRADRIRNLQGHLADLQKLHFEAGQDRANYLSKIWLKGNTLMGRSHISGKEEVLVADIGSVVLPAHFEVKL